MDSNLIGCKALIFAIIDRALRDAKIDFKVRSDDIGKIKKTRREAYHWLTTRYKNPPPFSCQHWCELLNIDQQRIIDLVTSDTRVTPLPQRQQTILAGITQIHDIDPTQLEYEVLICKKVS